MYHLLLMLTAIRERHESSREGLTISTCTSREGLHISAWAGKPMKGRRLWHLYWYLGYDVEPSCTELEAQ